MPDNASSSPLVSIVVPVFNGERYLRESLDSILAQTYSPIEVLVMDDASTDQTPSIAASYGNRLRSYRHPQRQGIYTNCNAGIALAHGEYVAIYHADDVYDSHIVEREVAFLEQYQQAGAVFSKDIFIDASGKEVGRLRLPSEIRRDEPLPYPVILNALLRYKNRFLPCPSSMVRASVYRDVGVYAEQQFGIASDLEMWLRIARKYHIGILDDYLFRYRQGHNSSGEQYQRLRIDAELHFEILDLYLATGDRSLAAEESLTAHEAHRAEDLLMRTSSLYILGRNREARKLLHEVQPRRVLASAAVQRGRLLLIFLGLYLLVRLPRIVAVAEWFRRRWHTKRNRGGRPLRAPFAFLQPKTAK
jgi:glycosyltransferase involved in cell wall biosynthesis